MRLQKREISWQTWTCSLPERHRVTYWLYAGQSTTPSFRSLHDTATYCVRYWYHSLPIHFADNNVPQI